MRKSGGAIGKPTRCVVFFSSTPSNVFFSSMPSNPKKEQEYQHQQLIFFAAVITDMTDDVI